jgi:hypothetical protein
MAVGIRVGAKRDHCRRPAVEIIRADDDLYLACGDAFDGIPPTAAEFDRGLDGFYACVDGEDFVVTKVPGDIAGIFAQQVAMEGARSKGKASSLFDQCFDYPGVAMTLVDGGIAAKAIDILVAVDVPDVDACAAGEDHGEGMVIVGAIFLFES